MTAGGDKVKTWQSEVLNAGTAHGAVLQLGADISFWGGVDPRTGVIIDRRHPQYGESVAGKILSMNRSIGSSSGSSILLELFQRGKAPSGIILLEVDFIITLGVVVAREMQFGDIPVVKVQPEVRPQLPEMLRISRSGEITPDH